MTTVNTNAAAITDAKTQAASSKLSADYDMFLKLLTAQMQNQDPLDPMDTAQYTQQLVQYSQVEQSIEQTSTLKTMLATMGTQNLTQASSLIGRAVETDSATAGLVAGSPAQWVWDAPRNVTSMTATIRDDRGNVVDTREVKAGAASGTFEWDGKTKAGKELAGGNYTVSLEGLDAGGNKLAVTPHAVGKVSDVQLQNGNVLVTINGMQVSSSSLIRIG
jgi:flagellar basal-body rod modification protein FlgD